MNLAEEYLKFNVQYMLENNLEDLEFFENEQKRRAKEDKRSEPQIKLIQNLENVLSSSFKRITYEEAISICIKVFLY